MSAIAAKNVSKKVTLVKIDGRNLFVGAGLLLLFLIFMTVVQFSTTNLVGIDAYFHIRFAQVMRDQGVIPHFPWLPLTILNAETFYDHHFLYHVLLMPFTTGNLMTGAKWASVIFSALALFMGWVVLREQRVTYAAVWALALLAVSEGFLYRLSMTRVQAVSLTMLLLVLLVALSRRHFWLLPLAFVYTWLYDAFPFLLVIVGAYVFSRWVMEGQFNLWPLGYTTLGIVLGLIINPYFPNNLIFIYYHWLPKLVDIGDASIGAEWDPYRTWTLVENSGLSLVAFVAGTFALGLNKRRMDTPTATLFLIAAFFGVLLFKSRRFIEYYPAFAVLFCAAAWSPVFNSWTRSKSWTGKLLPAALALLLIPAIWFNIHKAREEVQDASPYDRFAGASAWLQTNTPAGSRVFQTDWDDFPKLYFFNTHNTYTLGLDPTYMQLYNAPLYALWRDITRGRVEKPGQTIAQTFGANYVISDLKHDRFLTQAARDPYLEMTYNDKNAIVFRVHPDAWLPPGHP